MTRIVAIDPGASGGFAWHSIDSDPNEIVCCMAMPKTEGDISSELRAIISANQIRVAFIEEVGGYCGGPGAPGSAMFNFGRNFGFILGVLHASGIRIELVRPQKWQKHFSLGTVKESGGKTMWKNKLKSKAQQLFPTVEVTLKTADALLILEYGRSQSQ